MKYSQRIHQIYLVSVLIVCLVTPVEVLSQQRNHVWASPVSMTAHEPGFKVTKQLSALLVLKTGFTREELNDKGLEDGEVPEAKIRELLEVENTRSSTSNFLRYFDRKVHKTQDLKNKDDVHEIWETIYDTKEFIRDAIRLGGINKSDEGDLDAALKISSQSNYDDHSTKSRAKAYEILTLARSGAVRRSRGNRILVDILEKELVDRNYEKNISSVIEIRTNEKRSTISPMTKIKFICNKNKADSGSEFIFIEKWRTCDQYGVCKIGSSHEFSGENTSNPIKEHVFKELVENGRRYLDSCVISMRMYVDGNKVEIEMPGEFTSHEVLPNIIQ